MLVAWILGRIWANLGPGWRTWSRLNLPRLLPPILEERLVEWEGAHHRKGSRTMTKIEEMGHFGMRALHFHLATTPFQVEYSPSLYRDSSISSILKSWQDETRRWGMQVLIKEGIVVKILVWKYVGVSVRMNEERLREWRAEKQQVGIAFHPKV